MKRFGLFRRTVGLCLDQAARLWPRAFAARKSSSAWRRTRTGARRCAVSSGWTGKGSKPWWRQLGGLWVGARAEPGPPSPGTAPAPRRRSTAGSRECLSGAGGHLAGAQDRKRKSSRDPDRENLRMRRLRTLGRSVGPWTGKGQPGKSLRFMEVGPPARRSTHVLVRQPPGHPRGCPGVDLDHPHRRPSGNSGGKGRPELPARYAARPSATISGLCGAVSGTSFP